MTVGQYHEKKQEGDTAGLRHGESKVRKWYGLVAPKERREDFRKARQEFEEGVAEEVLEDDH